MIRNFLYSLFFHSIVLILVYFSFNLAEPIKEEKTSKVAISFVVKAGNSDNSNQAISKVQTPIIQTPKLEAPKEMIPEIVADQKKPKEKPKSKDKSSKKDQAKSEPKKSKPKDLTPKPEPKTEPKKIEPKKIEPKKPEPKKIEEDKPKEKKPKEEAKLETKSEIENVDDENKDLDLDESEDGTKNQEPEQSFTQNSIESLNLLAREKINIQSQMKRCYRKILDQMEIENIATINVHIFIEEDGYIDPKKVVIKDFHKYSDPKEEEFRNAVDVVKKSLKLCSPIRNLPQDKYDIWKEIDLEFGK
ncbi:MAG: outer membrane biosynthesis protein TonB [Rickettsiales bacterium]|jgi:outer membrane biosynthesis protein TonB